MTPVTKDKKQSNMVPRKKATREQRIEAVKYIKIMCEQGVPLNEALILRIWGTGAMVSKLVMLKVIKPVKGENYHEWISRDAPETVVDKYWHAHGKTPNRPAPPDKFLHYVRSMDASRISSTVASPPIDEKVKEKFQAGTTVQKEAIKIIDEIPPMAIDESLVTKYGGSVQNVPTMPRAMFIDNCIQECIQYKILEKGAYIDEKLTRAGYL